MSDELKWCKNFLKAVGLRHHRKARIRKKNIKRIKRLVDYAFDRWGYFPYPSEWERNEMEVQKK